ncbi:MAG: hypothetical protein KatS3mg004_3756 [Bryobacteraceae bacterium]|nr:MAG: hypothetical protein KatS3mg004_3756 [Bryobacteraceae bacterium]
MFGSLPGGRRPQPQLRSLGKLVLGRAEEFKVSVRATPVSGQPQMVQMVLPESLQPGVYGVFWFATEAGKEGVNAVAFEWNISTYGENAPCIDLVMTGGYGGLIERHDAGILGPLVLPKKRYTSCSPAGGKATSTRPDRLDQSASRAMGASPSSGAEAALIADCADYDACLTKAESAFSSGQPVLGATALKKATQLQPSKPEAWEHLVLLGHKRLAPQRGQQGSCLAMALASRRRRLAIENGSSRCPGFLAPPRPVFFRLWRLRQSEPAGAC